MDSVCREFNMWRQTQFVKLIRFIWLDPNVRTSAENTTKCVFLCVFNIRVWQQNDSVLVKTRIPNVRLPWFHICLRCKQHDIAVFFYCAIKRGFEVELAVLVGFFFFGTAWIWAEADYKLKASNLISHWLLSKSSEASSLIEIMSFHQKCRPNVYKQAVTMVTSHRFFFFFSFSLIFIIW